MRPHTLSLAVATLVASAFASFAQETKPATNAPPRRAGQPPPIISPEIRPDGGVTFRYRAPKATEVSGWRAVDMRLAGFAQRLDEDGFG